jgi:hypothetical protein
MRTKLVTAYVPIPNHPRPASEYGELGERLSAVPVKKKCFYQQLDTLWMTKYINSLPFVPRASEGDNPMKNTLAYHAVNHQKTTWLVQACNEDPDTDVFVWVDYGIFHLPGVNNQAIYEFMDKLDDKAIYAPGCWEQGVIEAAAPCWRFCGSVLAVPRRLIDRLDYACRVAARQHVSSTKNVEWEVNTWARVEQKLGTGLTWHWYKADHDVSLFNNLELADVA